MNVPTKPSRTTGERSLWREVVVPGEHGGWGLTLEPVLLGLLVAPSRPGVAIGTAASGAAIVIAGDGGSSLAAGVWLILAARSIGAIPFLRAQIAQARHGVVHVRVSDVAQVASVAVAAVAWFVDDRLLIGAVFVAIIAVVQMCWSRWPPPAITVIGARQMVIGVMVVLASAVGVWIN